MHQSKRTGGEKHPREAPVAATPLLPMVGFNVLGSNVASNAVLVGSEVVQRHEKSAHKDKKAKKHKSKKHKKPKKHRKRSSTDSSSSVPTLPTRNHLKSQ